MAIIKFIQSQSFALQSSGASAGDTSITVQSFKQIDGVTNLTTTDLGDKCYATIEPNNGAQEEAISFTGVTQNANGTATLTGVKSVLFVSPYTESTGLAKSHAGGVTLILSNDAGFYGNILTYINTSLASGAPLANSTTSGIAKLTVDPATGSNPIAVGSNDPTLLTQTQKNYVSSIINTGVPYALATGTSSAYTVTLASSLSTLASGSIINFQVPTTNASGATLNVNSLGAKPIHKNYSASLASGDLVAGQITSAVYDGSSFQIMTPVQTTFLGVTNSGQTTHDLSSNSSTVIPHGLGSVPKMVTIYGNAGATGQTAGSVAAVVTPTGGTVAQGMNVDAGTNTGVFLWTSFVLCSASGGSTYASASITADATNITLAWSKVGSPTGTGNITWSAIA